MSNIKQKLENIFNECDKHILRIGQAVSNIKDIMPLHKESYLNLTDEKVQAMDQFLFRFSKLQDAMGEKLFKTLLIYLDEPIENKPFIDILNRLEKLEILEDVGQWRRLRDIRNELSHNYDDEPEEMSIAINKIYQEKERLENIYFNIVKYYNRSSL